MRLGDLDALRDYAFEVYQGNGVELETLMVVPLCVIDNAPTVKFSLMPADESKEEAYMRGKEKGKIEGLLKARSQGEWIPITEKLPNTLGVYNVTRKLNEGETVYFISGASYFDGQNTWHDDIRVNHGRPYLIDIIAWQPLPESYKKGGAE